jgi:PEGA domain
MRLHEKSRSVVVAILFIGLAGCSESVVLRSAPPGATVSVGDKPLGMTPVVFKVPRSELKAYTVHIRKAGYEPVDDVLTTRVAPGRMVGAIFTLGIVYIFRSPTYLVQPPMYQLVPAYVAGQGPERARASRARGHLRRRLRAPARAAAQLGTMTH